MKILAMDFDETLFYKDENPPVRVQDQEAIRKFQEEGNLVGICTGRSLEHVLKDCPKEYVNFDFYILGCGGLLLDKDFNVIEQHNIDKDELYNACEEYLENTTSVNLHYENTYHAYKKPFLFEGEYWPVVEGKEDMPDTVYSISLIYDGPEGVKEIEEEFNQKYPSIAAYANVHTIDCAARGISKGTGVQAIKEYYHADLSAGIGDSFNDLPMIAMSDVSFALQHGREQLKEKSDYVVTSISEAIQILGDK